VNGAVRADWAVLAGGDDVAPDIHYAKSGDVHIAYQLFGKGPIDLVVCMPFVSNIEVLWDEPDWAQWLRRMGERVRLVMFDKRGTGMSDRVGALPGMDERMDDLRAVMDAAGIERAAVLGGSEGGPLASLFAATYPDRCRALALYGAFARFSSWIPTDEGFEGLLQYIDTAWGTGSSLPLFAPSRANDLALQRWWGRFERLGASPAAVADLMKMNRQIDVSGILSSIRVPTLVVHRVGDVTINVEGGRFLAANIPGARYVELPGADHMPFIGDNAMEIADLIGDFVTGSKTSVAADRVLATILFTDIVGSTEKAVELGDARWRSLLDTHNSTVRRNLARFRGREAKSTGDGFLITFDGPARAIPCACAIVDELRPLGIQVRAGLHTGECEEIGDDIGGIAVHIGARVAALAAPDQVLVSGTVKDLVAGSGLQFGYLGEHALKGVPGEWRVYDVERRN
jgi:class 3 adenylate cyclase